MVRHRHPLAVALPLLLLIAMAAACAPAEAPTTAPPSTVAVVMAAPATPLPSPSSTPVPSATPAPTPTPRPTPPPGGALDGLLVDPAKAARLPVAVLIDDARAARPQSGFNATSVVYQAPADGGESRYMMVFQSLDARDIGPVRSGRIYFVQWAQETRAAIAHYGGDRQSRSYLAKYDRLQFTNVDALGKGAKAYHRIKSRRAPHNGYTNSKALWAQVARLHGPATIDPTLARHTFIDPLPRTERPAAQTIRIPYHTVFVGYRYDRGSDVYRRSVDGKAHIDPADGKQVTARNVVVLYMAYRIDSTIEVGHARPVIGSIGTGTAWVFREGSLTKGTWEKTSETARLRLLDTKGQEIPLVRGRTFFQIVPKGAKVTHRDR